MESICGTNCCENCSRRGDCGGCMENGGHPFGWDCFAANCILSQGKDAFDSLKKTLIDEINALGIDGLSVDDLNLLNGFYVNLEYPPANGTAAKFLEDRRIYLGNQIPRPGTDRCFGVIADETMLLAAEYGENGAEPVLLCYKKRK